MTRKESQQAACRRMLQESATRQSKNKPAPAPAAARKAPPPPLRAAPAPSKATAPAAPKQARKAIDVAAVYAARNRPHDACGECGAHVQGPLHGMVSDNIKPAAPRARTLAQLARDVYGHAGGGEDPGLIAASGRGGR